VIPGLASAGGSQNAANVGQVVATDAIRSTPPLLVRAVGDGPVQDLPAALIQTVAEALRSHECKCCRKGAMHTGWSC